MPSSLIWKSRSLPGETGRDAATRFVREYFDGDRSIRWGKAHGVFWFHDSAWKYRIEIVVDGWEVHRTGEPSPRGKAYSKARRLSRPPEGA